MLVNAWIKMQWGNGVMGFKEGTWYDEHWVLYTSDELLKTASETNDVSKLNLKKKKKRNAMDMSAFFEAKNPENPLSIWKCPLGNLIISEAFQRETLPNAWFDFYPEAIVYFDNIFMI